MNVILVSVIILLLILCVLAAIYYIQVIRPVNKEQKDYFRTNKGRDIRGLCVAIAFILSSCAHRGLTSGTYTIESRHGNTTTFKGVKGKYNVVSDTLKTNDTITINVIRIIK